MAYDLHRRAALTGGVAALSTGAAHAIPPEGRLTDVPVSVTAVTAKDLEVVREINLARTDPLKYIERLPRTPTAEEAREFLRNFKPVDPLQFDERAWRAANGHLRELQGSGRVDHRGADGSMPMARMQRQGLYSTITAEGISAGQVEAADVVRQLIIDIQSPTRAHRNDLLNPRFRLIGPSGGPHPKYRWIVVIDYSAPPMEAGR